MKKLIVITLGLFVYTSAFAQADSAGLNHNKNINVPHTYQDTGYKNPGTHRTNSMQQDTTRRSRMNRTNPMQSDSTMHMKHDNRNGNKPVNHMRSDSSIKNNPQRTAQPDNNRMNNDRGGSKMNDNSHAADTLRHN